MDQHLYPTQNNGRAHPFHNLSLSMFVKETPDSKIHGANVGPTWGRQDPGGPHVGPIILVIWAGEVSNHAISLQATQCYTYRQRDSTNESLFVVKSAWQLLMACPLFDAGASSIITFMSSEGRHGVRGMMYCPLEIVLFLPRPQRNATTKATYGAPL